MFFVPCHNHLISTTILSTYPTDVLLLTTGPIIRSPLLYAAKRFLLNIHAAPLPAYRGNWTTTLALYNCERLKVSAHIVTNDVDMGPILNTCTVPLNEVTSIEQVNKQAQLSSIDCAVDTIRKLKTSEEKYTYQRIWEGKTWHGHRKETYLAPAMPIKNQLELAQRLKPTLIQVDANE